MTRISLSMEKKIVPLLDLIKTAEFLNELLELNLPEAEAAKLLESEVIEEQYYNGYDDAEVTMLLVQVFEDNNRIKSVRFKVHARNGYGHNIYLSEPIELTTSFDYPKHRNEQILKVRQLIEFYRLPISYPINQQNFPIKELREH